jgi:hypothetical protein
MNLKFWINLWLIAFLSLNALNAFSQTHKITGKVIDTKSGETLPFVHIIFNSANKGITSDIDGEFTVSDIAEVDFLKFSYVGYQSVSYSKTQLLSKQNLVVKMTKKTFDIGEVIVFPGENPAHRIIRAVLENRKENNPDKLESYSYKAYHKTFYTIDLEKMRLPVKKGSIGNVDTSKVDSTYLRIKKLVNRQHLFMSESVSEFKYKRPGKKNEKILISRVSGLKEPFLVLLSTQLQSFSFYNDMFTLLDSRYVNPISRGSTNRYFFNIEDTTYTERGDTVFSISFRPKKGKNFEGMQGVLNINSYKYAVQSAVAEPVEEIGLVNVKIVQNYKLVNDKHWFPNELNTDIEFSNLLNKTKGNRFPLVAISKSYIKDVKLNERFKDKEFSGLEMVVPKKAFTRNDSMWNKLRGDTLNTKEKETYAVIDSLGEKHNLDLKVKTIKTLSYGYIPLKVVDFDPFSLFDFNDYEGSRPGLRLKTNDNVSSFFSIAGYGAYGFNDEQWKYGSSIRFNLSPKHEAVLNAGYKYDVEESAGYSFFEEQSGMNMSEFYRRFFIKDMTYNESYSVNFQFRALKRWKVNVFASQITRQNTSMYTFSGAGDFNQPLAKYYFHETGLQLKYAPNESKIFVAGELFASDMYNSPVLHINYIKGVKTFNSDFDYSKLEAKLNLSFLTKAFGRTNIQLVAAKVFGDELPYFMLYNGHGSYYGLNLETANSFSTMRMNEFLSDEFVSFHFRQDFGTLLFKAQKFKPEVVLTTSVGFGQLEKPGLHNAIEFNTLEKGYYESGLLVNYLIRTFKIVGLGVGAFYRYGPYSYSNNSDNFAYKFTLMFKL